MIVTKTKTQRLIYFRGHPKEKNSVLITQLCDDYNIWPTVDFECASRTLANLYNLQTVRGLIDTKTNILILTSSMSGPHHYYGYVSPLATHILEIKNAAPIFRRVNLIVNNKENKKEIIDFLIIDNFNWISGKDISPKDIKKYNLINMDYDNSFIKVNNQKNEDSLFDYPGVLELEEEVLNIKCITDAFQYDLSSFGVQLVRNDIPFQFTRELVKKYVHAQHKLRVITYNYGNDYATHYLPKSNGIRPAA